MTVGGKFFVTFFYSPFLKLFDYDDNEYQRKIEFRYKTKIFSIIVST